MVVVVLNSNRVWRERHWGWSERKRACNVNGDAVILSSSRRDSSAFCGNIGHI